MFPFLKKKPEGASPRPSELDVIRRSQLVARLDAEGRFVEVNSLYANALGYTAEEILGQRYLRIVRQKDHGWFTDKLMPEIAAGRDVSLICPRLNKAGDEVWLDVSYLAVGGGQILILARDITEFHLRRRDNRGHTDAVKSSMATIEFDLTGKILDANPLFLAATGYVLDEILGKHHRIFMPAGQADGPDYAAFWQRLAKGGSSENGEVMRVNKAGEPIWLRATYETLRDAEGRPFKVVKYGFEVTEAKNVAADAKSQIEAIQKVQAVIEFAPDGKVLRANANFCDALGYDEAEIVGRHHSMFVPPDQVGSADYQTFWTRLAAGEQISGDFERMGKNGRQVFIRASYNPIRDASGRVAKVVKYAVDTTVSQLLSTTLKEGLHRLSAGDLSVRLTTDLREMDGVRTDFNASVERLQDVMMGVIERSRRIDEETNVIDQATDELARRTEQQAATLEESAAALEQLSTSVKSAAAEAAKANVQASEARRDTEESSKIVGATVRAVDAIAESSRKISSITSVIDDIAFQTNLLALNAGVEAARAGDAGRGFAVVASEVRALAQRSSEAAKEIAGLITTSEKQVDAGVKLVGQTGEALDKINTMMMSIHDSISQISHSAQEQATGLSELNTAIDDLDRAVQHNASMAEETNASAQSLRSSVTEMNREVSYFSIARPGDDEARRVA